MNTIYELFEYRCKTHPERKFVVFEGKVFSYKEIFEKVEQRVSFFLTNKISKSNRIAILDFNSIDSVILFLSSSKLGIIPVFLNWRFTENEIRFILEDSNIVMFLYSDDFKNAIPALLTENKWNTICLSDLRTERIPNSKIDSHVTSEDIALQLYTSGTTGRAKGVELSHQNLLQVIESLSMELPGFGADSINLVCAPFYHIGGLGYFLIGLYKGGLNVLLKKFDPSDCMRLIDEQKITNALLVPAMLQSILSLPNIETYEISSLRNIQFGGSKISEASLFAALDFFRCDFTQAYGLTECSGIATLLRYDELRKIKNREGLHLLESCGKSILGMEIKIINDLNEELESDQVGEICLRSNQLAKQYFNFEDGSFQEEGWFQTGDIGYLNSENYLFIVDRKKDLIISKSEKISPVEIETILSKHPKLKDVCIIGIPDSHNDEMIVAILVCNGDEFITLEDINFFLEGKLAKFKFPRKVFYVKEIIRNQTGKILRDEMKKKLMENNEE